MRRRTGGALIASIVGLSGCSATRGTPGAQPVQLVGEPEWHEASTAEPAKSREEPDLEARVQRHHARRRKEAESIREDPDAFSTLEIRAPIAGPSRSDATISVTVSPAAPGGAYSHALTLKQGQSATVTLPNNTDIRVLASSSVGRSVSLRVAQLGSAPRVLDLTPYVR